MGRIPTFIGEYRHNLDSKGRLAIPSAFRATLGNRFTATIGLDKCITIYTEEEWAELYDKLIQLPQNRMNSRGLVRMYTANAGNCQLDAQGRILLPQSLIKHGELTKECCIIGVGDHIEIWSVEHWENECAQTLSVLSEIAEQLPEIH